MKYSLHHIRLTDNKHYWEHQLGQFTDTVMENYKVSRVEFGKQDIRGGTSISLIDKSGRTSKQTHFSNKDQMLGFVAGFNAATEGAL